MKLTEFFHLQSLQSSVNKSINKGPIIGKLESFEIQLKEAERPLIAEVVTIKNGEIAENVSPIRLGLHFELWGA